MTVPLVSDQKIAETSSKGNQEKWQDGGIWYKLDQFGDRKSVGRERVF